MRSGYVAIVGRPNAGKSTLLNRIVGEKIAIVSDKPQTTRTRILGAKNYPGGQIVFVDTPGIHRPLHRMNVRMVDAAVDALGEVDAVVLLHDASAKPGHGDEYVSKLLKKVDVPIVLALNKIDRVRKSSLLPMIEKLQSWAKFGEIVPVSAATGDGVELLERVLLAAMPEGSMIKKIGTEAREDIERFFNCKVFLDLRVKVKPDWRDDEKVLDELGLPRKTRGHGSLET